MRFLDSHYLHLHPPPTHTHTQTHTKQKQKHQKNKQTKQSNNSKNKTKTNTRTKNITKPKGRKKVFFNWQMFFFPGQLWMTCRLNEKIQNHTKRARSARPSLFSFQSTGFFISRSSSIWRIPMAPEIPVFYFNRENLHYIYERYHKNNNNNNNNNNNKQTEKKEENA